MTLSIRHHGILSCFCILFMIFGLLGCGSNASDNDSNNRTASLTFELDFASLAGPLSTPPVDRALGEPDICLDYNIDTITVKVHHAQDNSEAASAQNDCSSHGLTVTNVPTGELLYVVCAGSVGRNTVWQGQMNGIVAKAGQDTNVGKISMTYVGTDSAAPEIASTYPAGDTTDVDLGAWVVMTFNEPLAQSSIPDNAITVLAGDTPVPGRISYDPAFYSIRFEPETAFEPETTYNAVLEVRKPDGRNMTDIAGQPFNGDSQWQFTTRTATDTTAPQIIAVSPAASAENVAPHTAVSVHFSEPMDPATMTEGVLQLSSGQDTIQGQLAYVEQNRTLTFTPEQELKALTQYSAVVSVQALDTAQNVLEAPYTWSFETRAIGERFDLNVTTTGTGSGTVVSKPAVINCGYACQAAIDIHTTVILEANPEENAIFTGWSGDVCDGTTGPCTFVMKADTNITAHFSLGPYTIDVSTDPPDGSRGVVIEDNFTVAHGENKSVTIKASPYNHLSELIVDGQQVPPSDTYLFENVTANHSLRAVFKTNAVEISDEACVIRITSLQINPDRKVVWQGAQGTDYNAYYYGGSMPPVTTTINNAGIAAWDPRINADGHVIWEGIADSDREIYYWEKTAPDSVNISQNPSVHDYSPQMSSEGHVVWQSGPDSEAEIFFWNASKPRPLNISANPDVGDTNPQLNSGGHVVWTTDDGSDKEIYYYNLLNSSQPVNFSNHSDGDDIFPQINALGNVVWMRDMDSTDQHIYDIYLYNASISPNPINISNRPGSNDITPFINNAGHVVWAGASGLFYNIYYYDGSTPAEPIVVSDNRDADDRDPQINSAGHVVWSGENGSDSEIYYWDGSMPPKPVNISNHPDVHDDHPQINDAGDVVWMVGKRGIMECTKIYLNCIEQCTAVSAVHPLYD